MKKIKQAFIEQIIEFPSQTEYAGYIAGLERGKGKFKVISTDTESMAGVITAVVRKQYNNNEFPEE